MHNEDKTDRLTDCTERQCITKTSSISEYAPPSPPSGSGVHRYQLLLYDVEAEFPQGSLPGNRSGFDLEKFRVDNGLGNLLASFQFTVEV